MKPAFALNLSHDGIGLLRRTSRGWLSIGEVSLDDPDLAESLSYLRKTALALSPAGLACKLVIPNSQILYTEVEAPGPDEAARRGQIARALEGMTPYAVADLVFDWRGPGPVVQVAVVAKETLAEAEAFAEDYRFGPVSFVAIPEGGGFAGEPFFGAARRAAAHLPAGETLERDETPVRIIGRGEPVGAADEPARPPELAVPAAPAPEPPAPRPETGTAPDARPPSDGAQAASLTPPPPADDGPAAGAGAADTAMGAATPAASAAPETEPETAALPEPEPAPEPRAPRRAPAAPRARRGGDKAAKPEAAPIVAERRPAPDVGGTTGLGARIAERRAEVMARVNLLPLALAGGVVALLVVLWFALGAWWGREAAPALPDPEAAAEPAIAAPAPLSPGADSAAPAAGGGAPASTVPLPEAVEPPAVAPEEEAAAPAAPPSDLASADLPPPDLPPPDLPPIVAAEPPAQPLAVPEETAAAIAPAPDPGPRPAEPRGAPGPAAAQDAPLPAQDAPGPPVQQADGGFPAIDPALRYDLTGVWTLAPEVTRAPPADRADAGLASLPDRAFPAAEPMLLAAPAALPGTAPAPLPNPPPFAPPPRRDAEGRIIPTPEGVVTAEGVTLVAGPPPTLPVPRPAPPVAETAPTVDGPAEAAVPADPAADLQAAEPSAEAAAAPEGAEAADAGASAAPVEAAPPVQVPPPDAVRPAPRPAGLAPADDASAPAVAEPGPATDPATDTAATAPPDNAETEPAIGEAGPPPAADPALADARPRPPTERASVAARAAAEARVAAAAREADLAAALAAASPLAVSASLRPEPRPRDFSDGIAAALALAIPDPVDAASAPPQAPEDDGEPELREAVPNIPTTAAVAEEATITRAIRLNELNLIGVFGTPGSRRALVRTPTGRFLRVEVGDRLDGGQVAAIGESELRYIKNGRTIVLTLPQEG